MSGLAMCKVDGCEKSARARGWCWTHYSRWYRNGDLDVRELAPCGTRAAYSRHRSRGEPVDDACRAAAAEFQRNRRAGAGKLPRTRALHRLLQEFPDRFRELLAEEESRS